MTKNQSEMVKTLVTVIRVVTLPFQFLVGKTNEVLTRKKSPVYTHWVWQYITGWFESSQPMQVKELENQGGKMKRLCGRKMKEVKDSIKR